MLHLVEVANEGGDILSLPLGQPTSGIILTGIDGLDPGKATLVSSAYAQQDGAEFHSARRESRNILMGFALDSRFGGGTARQLRDQLYAYLMPKRKVSLTFHLEENFELKIDGVIESVQSPMFSEKPVAVVSIICFNPDFYDPTTRNIGMEAFSTPYEYLIPYEGNVETGYTIELTVDANITSNGFTVYHRRPDGQTTVLDFSAQLQGLDEVHIHSVAGQKRATLVRAGVETSIIAGIDPTSVWPVLIPGDNYLAIVVTGAQFGYEVRYNPRYGGI